MFAGLFRYLADDDGNVRLDGDPLFTFSDGKKALLFEGTEHAFTWPVETPAQLTAHAYDLCRWQALFFADRIMVRMDRDWTQFERAYFTVPGKWISPSGSPHWKTVLTSDGPLDKIARLRLRTHRQGGRAQLPGRQLEYLLRLHTGAAGDI